MGEASREELQQMVNELEDENNTLRMTIENLKRTLARYVLAAKGVSVATDNLVDMVGDLDLI